MIFSFEFDNEESARDEYRSKRKRWYDCHDRTCGAPDCKTCQNGTPPWEEEEEEEE